LTYKPRSIDTADVRLDEEIIELIEQLAENAHDVWAQQRLAEGWRYGPHRGREMLRAIQSIIPPQTSLLTPQGTLPLVPPRSECYGSSSGPSRSRLSSHLRKFRTIVPMSTLLTPKPARRLRAGLRQSTRTVGVVSSWVFTGRQTPSRARHWARRCPTISGTGTSGRSISTRRMRKRHR
jgi:hypothetical protein